MTTRRDARRARSAAAGRDLIAGVTVPPELLDPEHPVWHDRARYVEYLRSTWPDALLPARDRMSVVHGPDGGEDDGASPGQRRQAAAGAWARANRVGMAKRTDDLNDRAGFVDWNRLRAWGLID